MVEIKKVVESIDGTQLVQWCSAVCDWVYRVGASDLVINVGCCQHQRDVNQVAYCSSYCIIKRPVLESLV